jgi:hypothetical protein
MAKRGAYIQSENPRRRSATRLAAITMSRTPTTTTIVTNHVAPKKRVESLMLFVSRRRKPIPRRPKWRSPRPKERRLRQATTAMEKASRLRYRYQVVGRDGLPDQVEERPVVGRQVDLRQVPEADPVNRNSLSGIDGRRVLRDAEDQLAPDVCRSTWPARARGLLHQLVELRAEPGLPEVEREGQHPVVVQEPERRPDALDRVDVPVQPDVVHVAEQRLRVEEAEDDDVVAGAAFARKERASSTWTDTLGSA